VKLVWREMRGEKIFSRSSGCCFRLRTLQESLVQIFSFHGIPLKRDYLLPVTKSKICCRLNLPYCLEVKIFSLMKILILKEFSPPESFLPTHRSRHAFLSTDGSRSPSNRSLVFIRNVAPAVWLVAVS